MFHCDEVRDAVEYTCGVKRESDEASALVLHEQEQVLSLVELHCGPGCGIAVVKSILKDAGYIELATQISQVHGRRAKAAHPFANVHQRLQHAFEKIGKDRIDQAMQKCCDRACNQNSEQVGPVKGRIWKAWREDRTCKQSLALDELVSTSASSDEYTSENRETSAAASRDKWLDPWAGKSFPLRQLADDAWSTTAWKSYRPPSQVECVLEALSPPVPEDIREYETGKHENDTHESGKHENETHENEKQENDMHENDKHENEMHEHDKHEDGRLQVNENDTHENDKHENEMHEHGSLEASDLRLQGLREKILLITWRIAPCRGAGIRKSIT